MITSIVSFLLKLGLGSVVDKTIDLMKHKASLENDKEKLKTEVTIEHIKAATEEVRLLTDLNKQKIQIPWFWIFAAFFVIPLGLWWNAVILDSIFHLDWKISNLPTQQMQEWAGQIVQWLFYCGSGIATIKSLKK